LHYPDLSSIFAVRFEKEVENGSKGPILKTKFQYFSACMNHFCKLEGFEIKKFIDTDRED